MKILVGISGGVDSAYAAKQLLFHDVSVTQGIESSPLWNCGFLCGKLTNISYHTKWILSMENSLHTKESARRMRADG